MKTIIKYYKEIKDTLPVIFQTELAVPYEFPLECQDTDIDVKNITWDSASEVGISLNQLVLQNFPACYRIFVHAAHPLRQDSQGLAVYHENQNKNTLKIETLRTQLSLPTRKPQFTLSKTQSAMRPPQPLS
ncbi:hypothetical protein TSAR_013116 [Trichomalopsis sarcophagae]|uniref:Uncharacterized protein n=1 Tax=Trichomalopsis sarcophagae TaxID=543379 RepID=A0A232ERE7_9HYME|nr:hypothetical protein TSAR_013116 [Trichomalopsis sarcophagae]